MPVGRAAAVKGGVYIDVAEGGDVLAAAIIPYDVGAPQHDAGVRGDEHAIDQRAAVAVGSRA